MGRRRFFALPESFSSTRNAVELSTDEARHLREVLRLQVNDHVYVFDGRGREYEAIIKEGRRDAAKLEIISEVEPLRPESPLKITIGIALLKSDKFDLVVQKVTELGATSIVPVTTKLADIKLRDQKDASKRVVRWQRIALEAAKQSGRAFVPDLANPVSLESVVTEQTNSARVFFSERNGKSLQSWEATLPARGGEVIALVGPEGGWTDGEIEMAEKFGWPIVTLGGRTLRAETAAIVAVTLLQHLRGDLR